MAYIGNQPSTAAFITDTFNGTGSATAFTMSAAPATTTSILVSVSGVLQDPSTYSVSGTTLTFSAAPPAGTGNISVRFLGIPASGVTSTAYRTQTEFTATAGQTTFSVPSYTVGFIDVYRNGAKLGTADFTATNGTTVVLASGASSGDLITTVSFYVSSVLNAIPATAGAVTNSYLLDGSITKAKMGSGSTWAPVGTVVQVVQGTLTTVASTSSSSFVTTGLSATITPTSSSSKILIFFSGIISATSTSDSTFLTIYRGASNIGTGTGSPNNSFARQYTASTATGFSASINYLDSPATTSSTTYTLYFCGDGFGTVYLNRIGSNQTSIQPSFITLMEIAA